MKITASRVIRWSGLAAMAAEIIFAGIQPIHPPGRSFFGHHRHMGDHHHLEDGHVPPVPGRHYGDLRQAG